MTGPEKFPEQQLPPINCFYDKLKDEPLKEEEFQSDVGYVWYEDT